MLRVCLLAIIAANLLIVSGCGGGGVSSGGGSSGSGGSSSGGSSGGVTWLNTVTSAEANVYRTNEYSKIISGTTYDQSLEQIHAAEAYALLDKNDKINGGDGIKISIIDTGAQTNHIEIAPNFDAANSYNYWNKNGTVNDVDGGHGTRTASIAAGNKGDRGIHGVAYDASLVISDVFSNDNASGSTAEISDAIKASSAISGVKVISMSLGYGSYSAYNGTGAGEDSVDVNIIASLAAAKSHDVLTVIASGNDAMDANISDLNYAAKHAKYLAYAANPKPSKPALFANNENLAGYVLAVGAVDGNSIIANFSNHCTDAKDYCLVAPGVNIAAAYAYPSISASNYYLRYSGTSMAAPHVAGAAAVLRGAWPFLTAPQVANILLSTATDLGALGVDDVYGHGLLNLYAAVQAQGSNSYAYGTSVSQTSYDVRQSSFATDPIFGDAFTHNVAPALQNAIFFDDHGRDYKAFLDKKITAKGNASIVSNLNGILLNNYKTNSLPLSFASNKAEGISSQLKFQVRSYVNDMAAKFSNLDRSLSDKALTASNGFSFAQNINHNNRVSFAFNIDELSNSHANKFNNAGFLSVNSIASNPYQSFVGSASQNLQVASSSQKNFNQLFFEHKLFEEKLKLNFSYQASYQSASIAVGKGVRQNQIMDVNLAYNPDEKTNLMLSFGNLNEFNNNFLNSQALGAFETGGDAKTSYTKIAMSRELLKNISAIASYSEGITKADGNNLGVFRDYQNIRSRSMSFGFAVEKILGGRISILYSEPLRVYSGKAAIDVPIARDDAGNVARYRADVSLKPQGKQQNFEMVYGRDLGQNSQLNFNFMISKDVGNVRGNNARLGMMIYKIRF